MKRPGFWRARLTARTCQYSTFARAHHDGRDRPPTKVNWAPRRRALRSKLDTSSLSMAASCLVYQVQRGGRQSNGVAVVVQTLCERAGPAAAGHDVLPIRCQYCRRPALAQSRWCRPSKRWTRCLSCHRRRQQTIARPPSDDRLLRNAHLGACHEQMR